MVGYVSKSADPNALVYAIRKALRGDQAWPAQADRQAKGTSRPNINVEGLYPELTSRQAEVFRALMRGLSDKQIARDLGVSDTTIKTHVRAIFQIVGVHKRGEAAYQARSRGAEDV